MIDIDEYDNIRGIGKNIAIVTPQADPAGYVSPEILLDSLNNRMYGSGIIVPEISSKEQLSRVVNTT